jgi:hypothetical protein
MILLVYTLFHMFKNQRLHGDSMVSHIELRRLIKDDYRDLYDASRRLITYGLTIRWFKEVRRVMRYRSDNPSLNLIRPNNELILSHEEYGVEDPEITILVDDEKQTLID